MAIFDSGITGTKTTMVFYKVQPDDLHNRIEIGSIDMGSDMPYFHSFGHNKEQLIFPRNSSNFNLVGMFEGHPMMDNFIFDYDNMLEFYVMSKTDGTYKKYTNDHGGVVLHSGNSYVEDNVLIYDTEMFIRCELNPFVFFDLNWLRNPERSEFKVNMRMRRYMINLDTDEITYKDLLKKDVDTAGFIMINPKW